MFKKILKGAMENQMKVVVGALTTVLIHQAIKFVAKKYPKLSFLRKVESV